MDKQVQDRIWNELSEETQQEYRKNYFTLCNEHSNGEFRTGEIRGIITTMENLFGTHNLNPKPTPKTWEDVVKEYPKYFKKQNAPHPMLLSTNELRDKLAKKVLAMYKIAILIESGYGGMVSEEEWNDEDCRKYIIRYCPQDDRKFVASDYCVGQYEFIAFHTSEQREEFWSYESNRKLVEQYYMM